MLQLHLLLLFFLFSPPCILFFSALLFVILGNALLDIGFKIAADGHGKLSQLEGIVLTVVLLGMLLDNLDNAF